MQENYCGCALKDLNSQYEGLFLQVLSGCHADWGFGVTRVPCRPILHDAPPLSRERHEEWA